MTKKKSTHYIDFSDEKLALMAQSGDESAVSELILRLMPTVKYLVHQINAPTFVGVEDLIQEAMIGVLAAINSFSEGHGALFRTYASRCASNSIISALRKSRRVISTIPLSDDFNGDDLDFSPEDLLLADESYKKFLSQLKQELSTKELLVLQLYLSGSSYEEISKNLTMSAKSVDNALQRARRKIKNIR